MASFYEMPSISPTMEVGTLIEWRLKEGDAFTPQTVIAEVGTDKANMEAEVFDDGVLIKLLIEEGDEVPPGFPIAIVGQSTDEAIDALLAEFEERRKALAEGAAEPEAEAGRGEEAAPPAPKPEPPPAPPQRVGKITREWEGRELPPSFLDPPGDIRAAEPVKARVDASPLARRIAEDRGLDLQAVEGTGPGGRVVKADVEEALTRDGGGAKRIQVPEDQVVRVSPMRKTIAKRLLQSHTEIPHFYLTVVLDMTQMVALRESLKAALPETKISYNDIFIACVGRALRELPEANASWEGKTIVRHGNVDVGMAVALDEGLITPVIRNADQKSLEQIATETRDLAGRAREGKLAEDEYTGGTFTVSNLGMMQIEEFTAIINPPETGILAVGALQQAPVVQDGQLAVGWRMMVTMTCDHRVVDGMVGARFLKVLRKYAENPILVVL